MGLLIYSVHEIVVTPECSAILKSVVHEVDRPHGVLLPGYSQWIRHVALEPSPRLDPQVQLQLAVDPIDPFVVVRQALDVPEIQIPLKPAWLSHFLGVNFRLLTLSAGDRRGVQFSIERHVWTPPVEPIRRQIGQ